MNVLHCWDSKQEQCHCTDCRQMRHPFAGCEDYTDDSVYVNEFYDD